MFKALLQSTKDRLQGNKAKANARLGLVRPPEGTGKVIWLVAGETYSSVLMAAALLAAIREKRKDVRLVLTYEQEYQDIIVEHMSGLSKIGFGYHCGDSQYAANQMLTRLSPMSVIIVGTQPKKTFLHVLDKNTSIHKLLFQTNRNYENICKTKHAFEACYPDIINYSGTKNKSCEAEYPPMSILTRLVQSQVDQQLGSMLCGEESDALFHVHNLKPDCFNDLLSSWRSSSKLANSLLAISIYNLTDTDLDKLKASIIASGFEAVKLSDWNQQPLESHQIVIADDNKWYAALCASSKATHVFNTEDFYLWQSLASGAVVTVDNTLAEKLTFFSEIDSIETLDSLTQSWCDLLEDTLLQRKKSDALRKHFWEHRRQAESQMHEFLQRVYDW